MYSEVRRRYDKYDVWSDGNKDRYKKDAAEEMKMFHMGCTFLWFGVSAQVRTSAIMKSYRPFDMLATWFTFTFNFDVFFSYKISTKSTHPSSGISCGKIGLRAFCCIKVMLEPSAMVERSLSVFVIGAV